MAERQQLQKAYGMKQALLLAILGKLALNGINAGQNVAVRQHHAARLRGGPGGEDDLRRIIPAERHGGVGLGRVPGKRVNQTLELKIRAAARMCCQSARADNELGIHIGRDALGEIMCGDSVHGHGHGAAQHAAKECSDPFRRVLAPQHHTVALADISCLQFTGKAKCQFGQLLVGPAQRAEPAAVDVGDLVFPRQVQLRIFG